MILKKAENIIGLIQRKKNLFVLDLENNADRIMIAQKRAQPAYLLSKDPKVRLWHYHFAYASNVQIIQAFKLVDGIKLLDATISNSNDNQFSSDLEADDGKRSNPDIDMHITPTPTLPNKIIKSIEDLCDMCIKSKYTRIIKHNAMILTVQKLEKIYANFWGPYYPPSISGKNYVSLLLDEYTQKSWVLLLKS